MFVFVLRTKQYMSDVSYRDKIVLHLPGAVATGILGSPEGAYSEIVMDSSMGLFRIILK